MRRSLTLLVVIACFATVPSTASDLLQGTVVKIDRSGGRLVLRQADTQKRVDVAIQPDLLPGFVKTGNRVTVWGEYIQRDPDVFQARKISRERSRGPEKDPTGVRFRGLGKDPTGVRSRLK